MADYYSHTPQPIALQWGDFVLPWYWLAYIAGFFAIYWFSERRRLSVELGIKKNDLIDLMVLGWIALLLGRLFYVLVYNLSYYLDEPSKIWALWEGGMSFHGGMLGAILAIVLLAKRRGIPFMRLADLVAVPTPLALGLGRIANFMNGELAGRVTDVPWAVIFLQFVMKALASESALQAFGEGFLLFLLLFFVQKNEKQ